MRLAQLCTRPARTALVVVSAMMAGLLVAGCGHGPASAGGGPAPADGGPAPAKVALAATGLPPGVMPAVEACRLVIGRAPRGFFTRVERVHLVLTSYAKGEPIESQGDLSHGMPAGTTVWVVEIHAASVNWNHSEPAADGSRPPPATDYSVVMNARTGQESDSGECGCWPLPLSRAGRVIDLPADC